MKFEYYSMQPEAQHSMLAPDDGDEFKELAESD